MTVWDPVSKQPYFKTAACRVTKVRDGDGPGPGTHARPPPRPATPARAPPPPAGAHHVARCSTDTPPTPSTRSNGRS